MSTNHRSRRQRPGSHDTSSKSDRLLTIAEAAERLGTTERFPRRLIAERQIVFVKFGTTRNAPVRIPESALEDFIAARTVAPAE